MTDDPSTQVALVVGAGGPTGAPFIRAALTELEQHTGWTAPAAASILGTSAGAFVAASTDATSIETTSEQFIALSALANGHLYAASLWHRVVRAVRRGAGSLVARTASRSRPIADYGVPPPPYHQGAAVVTVNRGSGRRMIHVLNDASSAEAVVRASAAIPGFNGPVDIDGHLHVDGAVHSAANVDAIDLDSHQALIVIAPMVAGSGGSLVTRSHRAQLRSEVHPWLRANKPVIVVLPTEAEHTDRRNRETFEPAGRRAVQRLSVDDI